MAAGAVAGALRSSMAARYACRQAARNPDWVGSTQIFTHLADEPTSISIRPVFLSGHLIGNLVSFGTADGAQAPNPERAAHPHPRRLVATRDRPCHDFPFKDAAGKYLPEVLLDLDYWTLMPRRAVAV